MGTSVPPNGILVPSPTFFLPRSQSLHDVQPRVDVATQVAHSVHLAKCGIAGLVLLGSTGEAIHLSKQERFDLLSGVRNGLNDAGFPDYPILAGVLVNNLEETLEWLQDAHKAGSQWGLVLAPGYFGSAPSQEGIIEWYNYPGVTNNLIVTPDTYAKLAIHPNIVGCKMSHGNVSHHVQVSLHPKIDHTQFRLYSGFGQQLGPIALFNAAGAIDGLGAIYPKTVVRLFNLVSARPVTEENLDAAQKLQWIVSSSEEFIGKNGILGIREAIFRVLGMGNLDGGRLPLSGALSEGEWGKWAEIMEKMAEEERSTQ
ncbi:Fc.00g045830.m01.CDS01 [Cosmosporella sp. VM-42]